MALEEIITETRRRKVGSVQLVGATGLYESQEQERDKLIRAIHSHAACNMENSDSIKAYKIIRRLSGPHCEYHIQYYE